MQCENPPPLSDETINSVLDGIAPAEALAHLQHCQGCTARLQQARKFERATRGMLHRWDCPPPGELGDYHLGLLALPRERDIIAHLQLCLRCNAEIEELRAFLEEKPQGVTPPAQKPQPRGWREVLVARLQPTDPDLQLAGVRGEGNNLLIAQSSVATIVMEALPAEREQIQVRGQIADETGDEVRWKDALVEVRQAGALIAAAFVDEIEGFSFGPITRGDTEVRVTAERGPSIIVEGLGL